MKNRDLDFTYKLLEEHSKNSKRLYGIIIFLVLVVIFQFSLPYITERVEISQTVDNNNIVNSKVKNEVK